MLADTWDRWFAARTAEFDAVVGNVSCDHPTLRTSELLTRLCAEVRNGNLQAIDLALAVLAEDPRLPFGRGLKSQLARALKAVAAKLSPYHRHALRKYSLKLQSLAYPPREAQEFARLLRTIDGRPDKRS